MSYQVDYSPLEYLQRRVKYYKKKKGFINNTLRKRRLSWYTPEEQEQLINKRIEQIDQLIKEYEQAIQQLEGNKVYIKEIARQLFDEYYPWDKLNNEEEENSVLKELDNWLEDKLK